MESEKLATQDETSTELQQGTRNNDSENLPSAEDAAAAASSVMRASGRGDAQDVLKRNNAQRAHHADKQFSTQNSEHDRP